MAIAPLTGDQRLVKHINRMALLRLLRGQSGLSRADLSQRSGLTRSTVSALIKELIDEGWLQEASVQITGAPGRRPTPLGLHGSRLMLVGAELGPDVLRVVALSIKGDLLGSRQARLRSRQPAGACRQLAQMTTALCAQANRDGARLLGIGVALPGAVDQRSGLLQFAPNLGWRDVAVGRLLSDALAATALAGVPVYCHNEADLAAVGETEFGARPVDDPLIYIGCGVGVGAGIILHQGLFTGATGSAGEIGHTTLQPGGAACSCGRLGCAEAYIGLRAIAQAAGCLADGAVDRPALQARMAAQHPAACAAFAEAGRWLGVLLHNIWATFNPMALVLGGEAVAIGGSCLLDAASAVLADAAARIGIAPPALRLSRHAEQAAAVGGAAYVLHALLNPQQPALRASAMP